MAGYSGQFCLGVVLGLSIVHANINEVGTAIVQGVQDRYFIAALLVFFVVISQKGINMEKKRIVSVLLAAVLLFTMDGGSLYAMGMPQDDSQYTQESQETEEMQQAQDEISGRQDNVREYTVSFDLNGGVTEDGQSSFFMQVQEGCMVDSGAIVEVGRKGYLFQGWKDSEGYYDFDQPVTGDITLFASWTPISYRIRFNLNGGKGETPPERLVTYDEEVTLPAEGIYKPDYVLNGWRQKNAGTYQEGMPVKNLASQEGAVVVLKAVWRRGQYKVRFHPNGGTGEMEDEVFHCGKSKKLKKNTYKREGYAFDGWNMRTDGKGKSYQQQESVSFSNQTDGNTVTLYAKWKGNHYTVKYDGNGAESGKVPSSSHVYGTAGALNKNQFKRKGYVFAGWNTKKDGKGKTYADGGQVKKLTTKAWGTETLYAKWKAISYGITYHTRNGSISRNYRRSYSIKTKTFSLPIPTRKGYDFDGWYQDAKYTKRVSEIKQGSTGEKSFYAKWVKCTRRPSVKLGKVSTCKAFATGKISVKATVKKRVASSDDCYYLVYVNPINQKPYKMAKKAYKTRKLSFTLETSENQGYAVSLFGIAVKKRGEYHLISNTAYVGNPEKAAKNKSKYKLGKTKKGMQYYSSLQEIKDCGAKNMFLNLTASHVLSNPQVPYEYNGKTYYFNKMANYKEMVSECNEKGINVTMQILLDWVGEHTDLIDSRARVYEAALYYTWNVRSNAAREKMEAMFCYLGEVFGTKKCYVSNWILGNEINNSYAGTMSTNSYFQVYACAFRSLYYAIRSQYSNAHIFICMDNLWNTSLPGGHSAKSSIAIFWKQLQKIQKGLKWNLAYHAYSAPLTYTNFWDGYNITYDENTPYITMKNLNVLTKYIRKHYGSSVRIILSEQGYSSSWGQANQAAALAASYYIAACNPSIDAFIIRSYRDHPVEVAQGLSMGIYGKEAFNVYKYMDTSRTEKYTKRYLKLIGISSWKKFVPGYKKKRLYTMYRK